MCGMADGRERWSDAGRVELNVRERAQGGLIVVPWLRFTWVRILIGGESAQHACGTLPGRAAHVVLL